MNTNICYPLSPSGHKTGIIIVAVRQPSAEKPLKHHPHASATVVNMIECDTAVLTRIVHSWMNSMSTGVSLTWKITWLPPLAVMTITYHRSHLLRTGSLLRHGWRSLKKLTGNKFIPEKRRRVDVGTQLAGYCDAICRRWSSQVY